MAQHRQAFNDSDAEVAGASAAETAMPGSQHSLTAAPSSSQAPAESVQAASTGAVAPAAQQGNGSAQPPMALPPPRRAAEADDAAGAASGAAQGSEGSPERGSEPVGASGRSRLAGGAGAERLRRLAVSRLLEEADAEWDSSADEEVTPEGSGGLEEDDTLHAAVRPHHEAARFPTEGELAGCSSSSDGSSGEEGATEEEGEDGMEADEEESDGMEVRCALCSCLQSEGDQLA